MYEATRRRYWHDYGANRRDPELLLHILGEIHLGPSILSELSRKDRAALHRACRALAELLRRSWQALLCEPVVLDALLPHLSIAAMAALSAVCTGTKKRYQAYVRAQKPASAYYVMYRNHWLRHPDVWRQYVEIDFASLYPTTLYHDLSYFLFHRHIRPQLAFAPPELRKAYEAVSLLHSRHPVPSESQPKERLNSLHQREESLARHLTAVQRLPRLPPTKIRTRPPRSKPPKLPRQFKRRPLGHRQGAFKRGQR